MSARIDYLSILSVVLLLGAVIFPAAGMFILPAALLWILGGFRKLDRFTRAVYCIFFGVSCWTWLPWLTRYVPISLSSLIWAVVLALAGLLAFLIASGKGRPRGPTRSLGKGTCLLLAVVTAVIVLARLLPTVIAIVPPGPDMSMHAYNARLIIDNNGIPKTQRPLVPIDSFGEYPIGFAMLIACTSLSSGLQVQTSAMLWTCLTYILLTFGLSILLRPWFTPAVSLLTAGLATFLAASPQIYSEGGGNPTVLSFAFIMAALGLFFRLSRDHSLLELVVQASLWGAALLTHTIPFLGAAYFLTGFGLCFSAYAAYAAATTRMASLKAYAGRCLLVFLIALLLAGPFLAGLSPEVSEGEVQWCKSWQRDKGHSWNGTIQDSLRTIPEYIRFTFKKPFVYIVFLGLLISTLSWKMRLSVFLCSLIPIGLVINSRYWVLPFSYALYPERMAMMLLAPMSVICAGLVDRLVVFVADSRLRLRQSSKALARHRVSAALPPFCASLMLVVVSLRALSRLLAAQWLDWLRFRHVLPLIFALVLFQVWSFMRERKLAIAAAGLSVVGMAACFVGGLCWDHYIQFYGVNFSPLGSVSQDDLRAFEWIKRNSSRADIILNVPEHDYSGLWIPAICGRRIMSPHSNPLYFDELQRGNEGATPAYLFFGSRPHGNGRLDPAVEAALNLPEWRRVASFGRAEVYQRRLSGPGSPAQTLIGPGAAQ